MWDTSSKLPWPHTRCTKKATGAQKTVVPRALSKGEETLALQLKVEGIGFIREFKFCLHRKWRADFALVIPNNILIEVEGGNWSGGSHNRGKRFADDAEKYNEAALMGFKVLRFTTDQVTSGEAIATIRRAIK